MLPLEILLSSIDIIYIGVDRVGSRLPLQGRCACLRLDLDRSIFMWWTAVGCVVLHQDLAVLRSCSLFFSTIPVFLSCCCLFLYYAVLRSVHPRSPRAAVRRRLPQRDARPQRCEKKQTVMCGGGKATHPTPFPLRECEPLMLTRVPIVSLFLELGLFAPGVLPVCLMMTVNVMASNRHLR